MQRRNLVTAFSKHLKPRETSKELPETASATKISVGTKAKKTKCLSSINMPSQNALSPAEEVSLITLKQRYDALLPKYGFLWRSMASKQMKQQHKNVGQTETQLDKENTNPQPSFLDAIRSKHPVSFKIHDVCGNECDCVDPILEIDENDSVYDQEELVDSDNESGVGVNSNQSKDAKVVTVDIDFNSVQLGEDSDDEVILTGKKKSRTFVIESDDESSQPDGEDVKSLDDESLTFDAESVVRPNTDDSNQEGNEAVLSKDITKSAKISTKPEKSDQGSVASENEWVDLSSDDEEQIEHNHFNTVVILSDDEYESESGDESESDAHSVFSIESSDSDATTNSEFHTIDRRGDRRTTRSKTAVESKTGTGRDEKDSTTSNRTKTTTEKPRYRTKNVPTTPKSKLSSKSSSLVFRKQRDSILSSTFSSFNQLAFQNALSSVEVTWSNKLNTTAGITRMKGKLGQADSRVATIELATKVIDNEERLRSTLLHEMCHAAAWLCDGVHKPPHGKHFKKWAAISMKKVSYCISLIFVCHSNKLSSNFLQIKDVEVTTTHDYQIAYKYAWVSTW